jgi:hypothetical protein
MTILPVFVARWRRRQEETASEVRNTRCHSRAGLVLRQRMVDASPLACLAAMGVCRPALTCILGRIPRLSTLIAIRVLLPSRR